MKIEGLDLLKPTKEKIKYFIWFAITVVLASIYIYKDIKFIISSIIISLIIWWVIISIYIKIRNKIKK
ncbi:hypothetical protein HYT26_01390 [Candidatus Pacearchaeota archaeon]|nr:hypothetical protein [Candidatus Pacearchaeota archaeon]